MKTLDVNCWDSAMAHQPQRSLEHASTLLFYSKKLAMEAAMDVRGEQYAWAAHYLCEMGKAVVDDQTQAMTPSS
ncbi:hypothetical protein AO063_25640 [Pseudomonas fluorescens ICMP 11288]|uniref:DUF3077 domain-containing protein n=2 Tax=Pseudomonas TaxID=286 RepID=A0A0W0I062_PSEFL|nr:hypothetical protein AO063_25640 [Pseudomonas fluorescens ICMP 11288]